MTVKFLPLLLLLVVVGVRAEQCSPTAQRTCEIEVNDTLPSGSSFSLRLRSEPLDQSIHAVPHDYWGSGTNLPSTFIKRLSLTVNETVLALPAKIYTDLGDVTSAEFKENEHALVLIVKGGEANHAYYATFVFVEGDIRKRTVRSQHRPNDVWEKTSFSATQNNDTD